MSRWLRHAAAAALASSLLLCAGAPASARSQLISRGPVTACRDVALTFDTEFSSSTQALADLLDELNVKTTWFFLGSQVESHAALVRQVAARHQIGNHTFTHPIMPQQSIAQMKWEIAQATDTIGRVAGAGPRPLFRPPYGEWNNTLLNVTESEGYPYVFLWSIDTRDWAGPSAESIRQHVLRNIHPGAIVLQHGSAKNTVEATRMEVQDLRARGYQFVTLTELLGIDRDQRDFGGDTYVVQYQDTWAQIGVCHNVSATRLAAYNDYSSTPVGYVLHIPHRDELIVELDGKRLELPVYPRVVPPGRAIAPVRLAEQLGAEVEWDGRQATVRKGDTVIMITPGDRMAQLGPDAVDMGTEAAWADDRLLMSVRFLAEQLGYTVTWNGSTWTASITSPEPAAPPPADPTP
ncbi:MAG TPA: polysaccharide deacetylase family protein [Symbiobacteriaceae bacterium]|nr:polysaccharide deacetylase family protein [Symbiobacteriaceae bacterium]